MWWWLDAISSQLLHPHKGLPVCTHQLSDIGLLEPWRRWLPHDLKQVRYPFLKHFGVDQPHNVEYQASPRHRFHDVKLSTYLALLPKRSSFRGFVMVISCIMGMHLAGFKYFRESACIMPLTVS